jgi:hypothetical protein
VWASQLQPAEKNDSSHFSLKMLIPGAFNCPLIADFMSRCCKIIAYLKATVHREVELFD